MLYVSPGGGRDILYGSTMKRIKSITCKNPLSESLHESVDHLMNNVRTCDLTDPSATQPRSPVVQGGRVYFIQSGDALYSEL